MRGQLFTGTRSVWWITTLFILCFPGFCPPLQAAPHHDRALARAVKQLLNQLPAGSSLALMEVQGKAGQPKAENHSLFQQLDAILSHQALAQGFTLVERSRLRLLFDEWSLNDSSGSSQQRQLAAADFFIIGQLTPIHESCLLKAIHIGSGTVRAVSEAPLSASLLAEVAEHAPQRPTFLSDDKAPWVFPEIKPPLAYNKRKTKRHSKRATASKMSEACNKATEAIVRHHFKGRHPSPETYRQAVYQASCTMVKKLPNGKNRVEVVIEFYQE